MNETMLEEIRMLKHARKESGEAKFERTCTRKTMGLRRMQLARNVPGTQEHGRAAMYNAETNRILARLRADRAERRAEKRMEG